MMAFNSFAVFFHLIIAVNVNVISSIACPTDDKAEAKAIYNSDMIYDMAPPITIDRIKTRLRESGIFDANDPSLSTKEQKELAKLFTAVEIMATSRNRQPSNVQNVFSSLRIVERALKKQLKEGQLSKSLAAKFNWDKLSIRQKRMQPNYYLSKTTNMRIFNNN